MSDEIICECGHEADVHNGGCTWSGCDCGESASGLYNDTIAALREEVDGLLQNDRQATDEFNAGYEAFTAGLDVDAAEIEYRSVLPREIPSYDTFSTGYAWAKFQAERKAG
jgi:hypothetical protein